MKLLTAKLTFDGKKDANFLFNTCVRSFVTFFFFYRFEGGRNTIVLEKAPEVIFAFFSRREFEFFLKLKGEDFATQQDIEEITDSARKSPSLPCWKRIEKKKNLTCPLAHFLQGQYDCHVTGNDRQNWDDQAEDEEESYIGLALGYGIVELPGHAARHVPRLRPVTSPSEQWRQREA